MVTSRLLPPAATLRREAAQMARIVIVAAVAWSICVALGADYPPVFAVVVPLVSLRDDPFSAFNVSLARLVGVVAGLAFGIGIVQVLPPGVLAMCLLLVVGLAIGMLLRIGKVLNIQVAVSALLVFSSPDAGAYGWMRLWETGVGTAATLLLAPFLFPANPLTAARRELASIADILTSALADAVAITGRPGQQHPERIRELLGLADAVQDVGRSVHLLVGQITTARKSAPWSVLRRRELRAVGELDPVRELADRLVLDLLAFIEESLSFGGRPEFARDPQLALDRIAAVSDPLGAAILGALTGRPYRNDLARAQAAVAEFRATEHAHIASVARRPLHRMVEDVARFSDGSGSGPRGPEGPVGAARPGGGGGSEQPSGSGSVGGESG